MDPSDLSQAKKTSAVTMAGLVADLGRVERGSSGRQFRKPGGKSPSADRPGWQHQYTANDDETLTTPGQCHGSKQSREPLLSQPKSPFKVINTPPITPSEGNNITMSQTPTLSTYKLRPFPMIANCFQRLLAEAQSPVPRWHIFRLSPPFTRLPLIAAQLFFNPVPGGR